ncbi:alpha-glucuronidase family glycosyl hydrolase [Stakelama pacifica]|uniref:Xylan alpha-1,2-glucuronidase n=1 Tax=Stakelama pacifica TaxID=517720 RepID=A0A4R6FY44_9SPHN|nr:alpha-glucuronidase family glycosyl hydrolase [Stakelama pacifica]TDN86926.1 alpha-glucuronidase [Stakelama pacifica]GGO91085.1 xylan alpha-1,2-glucuronidase [Stakelama pacifica]
MRFFTMLALMVAACSAAPAAQAEDGYRLWLRYEPVGAELKTDYVAAATQLVPGGDSATIRAASDEFARGLSSMLGSAPAIAPRVSRDGAILYGTPATSPAIAALKLPLSNLGKEGFLIRSVPVNGHRATVIAANEDVGVLYGVFHLLERMERHEPIAALDIAEKPKLNLRLLNHWDNLDGHVERGYSGESIWDWFTLPEWKKPRYTDYARADASIGINGTVLNNVNASPDILQTRYLEKVATLADIFRPYGIKVYLSANFGSPVALKELDTADPLDPRVQQWWQAKADEIYRLIPDFGGFLVKANSEGQPGPQDYHRSHAEGANMLAAALKPHHGIVMWRAFVYSAEDDTDRARQAYAEFKPLDGKFADNVVVQVKNGPIDFQPREPFHPLFGAMPETPLMMEVQITKEYLGFNTHLAYLGTMWAEALDAYTGYPAPDNSVAGVLEDGKGTGLTGMAGVANVGSDRNWSGSEFDQANWYAFGRFAWNPSADPEAIARDWTRMTWGNDPKLVETVTAMMMRSREAVVDYMTPLGLTHQMATGHHHGPGPWISDLARPEWNPAYYNRADSNGIGFDRSESGTDAVADYAPEVGRQVNSITTTPEMFLLWFHHLPWDYKLRSGDTLWDGLVKSYDRGVDAVAGLQRDWASLKPLIDTQRFDEETAFLAIQHKDAKWWRDASIAYFQSKSNRPLPAGHAEPPHDLEYYKAIRTPYAPGQ